MILSVTPSVFLKRRRGECANVTSTNWIWSTVKHHCFAWSMDRTVGRLHLRAYLSIQHTIWLMQTLPTASKRIMPWQDWQQWYSIHVCWKSRNQIMILWSANWTCLGNCSWEYTHDYNTYIQKFKVMYIESNNGTCFFVTNERTWHGVRLIKYTRQCVIPMQPSTESFSLWYDTAGLVEFNYFILDDKFYYTGIRQSHNDKVLCLLLQYNPQQQHRHVMGEHPQILYRKER